MARKARWERPNIMPMGQKYVAVVTEAYPRGKEVVISERDLPAEKSAKERVIAVKKSRGESTENIDPNLYLGTGRGKTLIRIPTDSKGVIDQNIAIARLMQVEDGDRGGRVRNAFVDLATAADGIAPDKPTTDQERLAQYAWYLHPNETDFKTVDTPNAKWVDRSGSVPVALSIKGNAKDRKSVIQVINDNFSNHEKRIMAGLTIDVKANAGQNAAGWYRMAQGKGKEHDLITIGRQYLYQTPPVTGPNQGKEIDDVTLTHELVHYLRARDPKRSKDPLVQRAGIVGGSTYGLSGKDRDLEESFTDSEALVRHTKNPTKLQAGYHQFLKAEQKPGKAAGKDEPLTERQYVVYDKAILMGERNKVNGKFIPKPTAGQLAETASMIEQPDYVQKWAGETPDRREELWGHRDPNAIYKSTSKLFKHKKGANAYNAISKAYPSLTLSQLKHSGPVEAIDTYWSYKAVLNNKPVTFSTQIYSPRANITRNEAIDIAVPDKAVKDPRLGEWRDGKLFTVQIPKSEKPPTPRTLKTRRPLRKRRGGI
jgi:hypothetical protein